MLGLMKKFYDVKIVENEIKKKETREGNVTTMKAHVYFQKDLTSHDDNYQ